MAKKRKRKPKKYDEYEEYDEYDEDESYDDDDEDEDEDSEEDDDESVISCSPARSVGGRKKPRHSGSSFIRAKVRPPQSRQTFHAPTRHFERERRGPHFALTGYKAGYKDYKDPRIPYPRKNDAKTKVSLFAAWGKIFVLVLVLAGGTWLAFSLGGGASFQKKSIKEVQSTGSEAATNNNGENTTPEIVQRPKTISQNQTSPRTIRLTSAPFDLSNYIHSKTLLRKLSEIAPMVKLPGGTFQMGDDRGKQIDQRPAHQVKLSPFMMDVYPVTNRQFQLFVTATGYKTTAEKQGWSYVFDVKKKIG